MEIDIADIRAFQRIQNLPEGSLKAQDPLNYFSDLQKSNRAEAAKKQDIIHGR